MNRRDFIKLCQLLGLALPLKPGIAATAQYPVIIVGAGPAGLSAGYMLKQQGIPFVILEAAPFIGGRIRHNTEFADFPLPLGAEWIHVPPGILNEIVNDDSVTVDIQTTAYDPEQDIVLLDGKRVSLEWAEFTKDSKFIGSSWFAFFERYIVPSIAEHIVLNTRVTAVDCTGEKVRVSAGQQDFVGRKVIVTVPVKLLQLDTIQFVPALPDRKQKAIDKVRVWDGCKAFIKFSKAFYPAVTGFSITPSSAGQKLYYDAAYGQHSEQHILGLFAVGTATQPYTNLDDSARIDYMLNELDALFDGQASKYYVKHLFQNWNTEPFAQGAYIIDDENWRRVAELGRSVGNRLFFAGDAYTDGEDWSSVHTAVQSARRAVNNILSVL